MSIKHIFVTIALLAFLSLSLGVQPTIVSQFNEVALQALNTLPFGPTVKSRTTSILHTAIFNAWAQYDDKAVAAQVKTFSRQPKSKRTLANKKEAVSYAAYVVLKTLLPGQQALFDQVMLDNDYDIQTLPTDPNTAAGVGVLAAQKLLAIRENDGSNQLGNLNPSGQPYSEPILMPGYTPYKYVNTVDTLNDINHWQPVIAPNGTPQKYATPQWSQVTPFALCSGSEFRPKKGPLTTDNYPAFVAQAKEVYDLSLTLTDEQKVIAKYWAAGLFPDPSPWDRITREVSQRDGNNLDEDVKMFFAVSSALFDAAITVWDTQRYYNSVRPISVIRHLFDSNWKPLVYLPPHPDYISGHSTMSGAAAEVLKRFTGSDYYGGSYTDPETGVVLSWQTFSETADQVSLSRWYGGIHFKLAVEVGRKTGKKVGSKVWNKVKNHLNGNVNL